MLEHRRYSGLKLQWQSILLVAVVAVCPIPGGLAFAEDWPHMLESSDIVTGSRTMPDRKIDIIPFQLTRSVAPAETTTPAKPVNPAKPLQLVKPVTPPKSESLAMKPETQPGPETPADPVPTTGANAASLAQETWPAAWESPVLPSRAKAPALEPETLPNPVTPADRLLAATGASPVTLGQEAWLTTLAGRVFSIRPRVLGQEPETLSEPDAPADPVPTVTNAKAAVPAQEAWPSAPLKLIIPVEPRALAHKPETLSKPATPVEPVQTAINAKVGVGAAQGSADGKLRSDRAAAPADLVSTDEMGCGERVASKMPSGSKVQDTTLNPPASVAGALGEMMLARRADAVTGLAEEISAPLVHARNMLGDTGDARLLFSITDSGARDLEIEAPFIALWTAESGDFSIRANAIAGLAAPTNVALDGFLPEHRKNVQLSGQMDCLADRMRLLNAAASNRASGRGGKQGRLAIGHKGRYRLRISSDGTWRLKVYVL